MITIVARKYPRIGPATGPIHFMHDTHTAPSPGAHPSYIAGMKEHPAGKVLLYCSMAVAVALVVVAGVELYCLISATNITV